MPPRSAGRDETRDRHGRIEDGAYDVAHRRIQSAGRVHLQDHQRGAAIPGLLKAARHIFCRGGAYGAVDVQDERRALGSGHRRDRKCEGRQETEQQDEDAGHSPSIPHGFSSAGAGG